MPSLASYLQYASTLLPSRLKLERVVQEPCKHRLFTKLTHVVLGV